MLGENPRIRTRHRAIPKIQHTRSAHPQAGFGQKPKAAPRYVTPRTNIAPYSGSQQIMSDYGQAANAIQQALMGQAQYDVGQVRNRQNWQQAQLAPYAQQEMQAFSTQAHGIQAAGDALSGAARQLGYSLGSQIGQKLTGIQAPGAAQQAFAASQGQTGEGVAGAIGGLTTAEVNALQGVGHAYSDFSGKLGGIAGLAGDGAARDIARQAALQYAQDMAQMQVQQASDLREQQRYEQEFAYRQQQDAISNMIAMANAQTKRIAAGAKTVADRKKRFQQLAAQRTAQTGY